MLKDRGIKIGVEVYVKSAVDPDEPEKKARVVNTYPPPSSWLVVRYEDGNMQEVEENQITTMFERNIRKAGFF